MEMLEITFATGDITSKLFTCYYTIYAHGPTPRVKRNISNLRIDIYLQYLPQLGFDTGTSWLERGLWRGKSSERGREVGHTAIPVSSWL